MPFMPWDPAFFHDVTMEDLDDLRTVHQRLQKHDSRVVEVHRFIGQVGHLKTIPAISPLRFLGYFAVLEGLITHAPDPKDSYDSITRQVKKKIALLNNRWTPRLDYGAFGGTEPEALWTKMYSYRSILAHGGAASFQSKRLHGLGNHENALRLLQSATKAALRFALEEPQLLADLREC
jgi:hypothetical protein